jgi:LruC domain-containing protein
MKFSIIIAAGLTALVFCNQASAQVAPGWGNAASFAVLANTRVDNVGGSFVSGDLGVTPGTLVTGFSTSGIITGNTYVGLNSVVTAAMASANTTYTSLKNQAALPGNTITDLSGKTLGLSAGAITLTPGIYTFSGAAQVSGTLTLDNQGDPNAIFIFRIGSTLTADPDSHVTFPGRAPNVFWQVGTSATLGTRSTVSGNIIAKNDIVCQSTSFAFGRLISLTGKVSMNGTVCFASMPVALADTDGDGVADVSDAYPTDGTKAYNTYSTLNVAAFEDQWPIKGDFDMNDLVIDNSYQVVTNASNKVVQVISTFGLRATGGDFENGFAVEYPVARGSVTNVVGGTLEPGQTNAVIVLFNNMHTQMATGNTVPGAAVTPVRLYSVSFDITDGPLLGTFGTDFNPFIFGKGALRKEVHLPGKTPTSLADLSFFSTGDDVSSIANGRYYKTAMGLPYALMFPSNFSYPAEGKDIRTVYLHFTEWAESGGILFPDWYSNTAGGYRTTNLVYTR